MNKKYLKFSIIGTILSSAVLIASITPPIFLTQNTSQSNQNTKSVDKIDDTDYTNELDYIKKDVEKQGDVETSVASIELVDSSFMGYYSAALVTKTDGSTLLYMWGFNSSGQLGNGSTTDTSVPTQVKSTDFGSRKITQVALGGNFAGVLLDDGSVYLWGQNHGGQLGFTANTTSNPNPTKLTNVPYSKKITQLALGSNHAAALAEDGNLYVWGLNGDGQLGIDNKVNTHIPTLILATKFNSEKIIHIALGNWHSAVLTENGNMYMWGYNSSGQMGNGSSGGSLLTPTLVAPTKFGSEKITQIELGGNFSAAVVTKTDGSTLLYMWGANGNGQTGNGGAANIVTPTPISPSYFNSEISKLAVGRDYAAVLLKNGNLYMWGRNDLAQLGFTADADSHPTPILVANTKFAGKKITDIALGYGHSSAFTEDGSIYMWGWNQNGQLGLSSTATNVPNPTVMSRLGPDSHITANPAITAKEAVDNMWVNNSFNLSGFKDSFALTNILETTGQEITMAAKPTYDNQTGTLTMKVGIKYFYDEDGLFIANTAATAMVFTGVFMPSLTKISVKTDPKTDIVVDKWLDSVKELTYIDRQKLEEYLLLENVPQDAAFAITITNQNLQTGELKFNITSSLTTKQDGSQTGESEIFPITLSLTPRITTLTTRTDYNKIAVDKLKDLIFDTNGVAITDEIRKYINYDATVEGATLNLKPNSYVINTGMGTANFTVFFDKYYDASGAEKSQTASALTKSFDVSLQLLPMATVITSKASYTPTHRVDRFISTFTDANGNVTNETILKQYIDLQNLPTGYALKVSDVNIIDPIEGTMSFNITTSKYNDQSLIPQENGTFPIQLLKLLPKYPTTDITAKAEGDYDDTVRLDRFITLFAPAAGGVVTDLNKLGEFLDLVSIPETATVTVSNIVMTNATGKITFNVIVNQYYDVNSDLQTANKTFPVTLYLGIKYIPTEITANTNIVYPERIDRFETKINELSGTAELQAYLQTKYITIVGDLPKNTTFSVANIVSDLDTGIMNFDLITSDYYDENSDPQKEKTFALTLGLRIKYAPTVLVPKAQADLGSERIDRFAHTIAMFTNQDLKNYLKDYVEGIETLVVGSTLVASNIVKDDSTGIISFDLETNKYYDADSDFQAAIKTWSLSLELTSKHAPTTIEAKTEDFTNIRVDSLIPSFTNEQLIVDDKDELNKYVTITALPDDAQLSVKDANMTFSTGMILFKIVADKYYDGESDLVITYPQEFIIQLALGIKYQSTTVTSIKGYDQSVNVKTFAEQIKTLTGAELKTYLATYIQTKGDIPADAVMSVDVDTVVYDEETGKVSFNVLLDKYYDADGSLQTNGSFTIKLKLAF